MAIHPLELGIERLTTAAALVGQPQRSTGCLVYVHRGCLVGDALRAADCARRRALDAALDRMRAAGQGVVVYHRDERTGFGGCCLGARSSGEALSEPTVALSLNLALDQLELSDPRLLVPREKLFATAVTPIADYVAL